MLLKINNLKFTISLKYILTLSIILSTIHTSISQEVIEDETDKKADTLALVANNSETTNAIADTTNSFKPIKVDGVAAVVGDYIILESDIDQTLQQLKAQGISTADVTRCQLFGKLLEDKLYAHHAIQDSIVVSDTEIRSYVDQQIQAFLQQTNGSMEELLKIYNKEDEKSLKDEMFEINKSGKLSSEMQTKIIDEIEITPDEVRQFFNKIPEDQRPTFGTELKVAQIVIEPKVSEEDKQKVINQLKEFKADVEDNGASFRSKVVLYSDDKASIRSGGKYTLNRKQPRMVKEFREVAFSLQEGEISEPFETEFGFHIIYLEKIRGQEYDVSHILRIPEVSNEAINEAKEQLTKIRERIVNGDISFADAARESSEEKETKNDGGQLINPATQDYNFELTKMDPELYGQIQNLKDNEVSLVLTDQDRTGKIKFKILTVTDRIDEHEADYARDYLKIKELALNEKRLKEIEKWQNEKIMDTYIKISDEHKNCDFSSNWLKE
ncbi:peptidylprolyl isomerase [Yeosuana sp. MJ-SS3]|uniref:Peptidylprolyl isomerase n=1 Tax=Gilvirhabdus luticola TaxID=3079858 RepID=A0ABU3U4S6_9FLAO|nr:peptidylprolyl isomerase [Yeosuana sp. MJ-SS3]MDU8885407.1 peptidylprolyl isomerase [Yeosuana sp. MJ-SS3]